MKQRLLVAPKQDGEFIFVPEAEESLALLRAAANPATAHQPYFFNPGVSVKFLLVDSIADTSKKVLFVDTDRVRLEALFPGPADLVSVDFVSSERVLYDYPTPSYQKILSFFSEIDAGIAAYDNRKLIQEPLQKFKEIFLAKKRHFLKEILAESFLAFYGIKRDYEFVSALTNSEEFWGFFRQIYLDHVRFRTILNESLDEYRDNFRFRFKNFPFPKLADNELPFWIIYKGERRPCYVNNTTLGEFKRYTVLPRAVTLSLFLRLFYCDVFVHGIGGGNYEWIGNRLIERFFKARPPAYVVASATFLLAGSKQRQVSYFFFAPERIRASVLDFLSQTVRNSETGNRIPTSRNGGLTMQAKAK